MPRARNIKPGFFRNEILAAMPATHRLLFIGLWTEADRRGRLEDRPLRLKMAILPLDDVDVDAALWDLQAAGFVVRYSVDGVGLISIPAFEAHQHPHHAEKDSAWPAETDQRAVILTNNGRKAEKPGKTQGIPEANPGAIRLIPDSGYLIPDTQASSDACGGAVVQFGLSGLGVAAVVEDVPIEQIAREYNARCHMLPPVDPVRVRAATQKAIRARWKEDRSRRSLAWWCDLFDRVASSHFLTGRRTDFRATLDWLCGPKNLGKVLDGQYDSAPGTRDQVAVARARRQWSIVAANLSNPRGAEFEDPITNAVIGQMGGLIRLSRLPRFDLQNEVGRFIDDYVQMTATGLPGVVL